MRTNRWALLQRYWAIARHTWPSALPLSSYRETLRRRSSHEVLITIFRGVVVGSQAATVLVTWPLWQVRDIPPMLPALPLPQFDLGIPLLLSLGLIMLWPLPGLAAHTSLVAYAVLIDQTRLQPEIVSLNLLLWGTLALPGAQTIAKAHLVSLWLFAGLNKLLSPSFLDGTAQWLLDGLIPNAPGFLRDSAGYVIGVAEMGIALLALVPSTRRAAASLAFVVHVGILASLSPLGRDWNQAVWPWNGALALSGFALIAPWKEAPLRSFAAAPRLVRPLVALLLLAPLGYYVGTTDAYLAHNLYSGNTPRAEWCHAGGSCIDDEQTIRSWAGLKVPLPPEQRLFEANFSRACQVGDWLIIRDPRWWASWRGAGYRVFACPP